MDSQNIFYLKYDLEFEHYVLIILSILVIIYLLVLNNIGLNNDIIKILKNPLFNISFLMLFVITSNIYSNIRAPLAFALFIIYVSSIKYINEIEIRRTVELVGMLKNN